MLKPKPPQTSFFMSGSYLYDRIVPQDHLLRKINQVVDFSFVHDLVKDRYTPDFSRPAEDPEFILRLLEHLTFTCFVEQSNKSPACYFRLHEK